MPASSANDLTLCATNPSATADLLPHSLSEDTTAPLSATLPDDIGAIAHSGDAHAFSVAQDDGKEPGLAMLDAQAVQAQVEALLKSGIVDESSDTSGTNSASRATSPAADSKWPAGRRNSSEKVAHQKGKKLSLSLGESSRSPSSEAPGFDASALISHRFQNTFAQYQYPQNLDRALKVRSNSMDAAARPSLSSPSTSVDQLGQDSQDEPSTHVMTLEEEERAADALLQDIDSINATEEATTSPASFEGVDLAAAARAIGLNAETDLLGGTEEDQRALANAIKRLGAEHEEAAQKALQQAADAAAAAAAAARASLDLASNSTTAPDASRKSSASSSSASGPSHARSGTSPSKRFACTKCDKAFARAYNLNTHLATHDPDPNRSKPFACPYPSCKSEGGRAFSRKHDLQRHVASIHEKEAEPGIKGDPQEVSGGDTGGLVSLGLGTPGKKFRCQTCGRSFVRRDACNRHQCDGTGGSSRGTHSPLSDAVDAPRHASGYSPSTNKPKPIKMEAVHHTNVNTYPRPNVLSNMPSMTKQLPMRIDAPAPARSITGFSEERRTFPLTAMSLYASPSASSANMHSTSASNPLQARVTSAK